MDKLEKFEEMLEAIKRDHDNKTEQLEQMRACGREKSSTFKLYMADKLLYSRMLSIYEKHGLL